MFCDEEDVPLSNNGACMLTSRGRALGAIPLRTKAEGRLRREISISFYSSRRPKWLPNGSRIALFLAMTVVCSLDLVVGISGNERPAPTLRKFAR
ncbi:MAG: hypothetical protein V7640_2460 [Betaproteobacteria bacterium]